MRHPNWGGDPKFEGKIHSFEKSTLKPGGKRNKPQTRYENTERDTQNGARGPQKVAWDPPKGARPPPKTAPYLMRTPMERRKAWVSASVRDISREKISLPAMAVNGVSGPSACAIPAGGLGGFRGHLGGRGGV